MLCKKKVISLHHQTTTKNTKIMETKIEMYKRIKRNCLFVTDDEYTVCGEAFCCDIVNNVPVQILIRKKEQMFIFMIGIKIWIVPTYLNNIFSINEIANALMQI